MSHISSIFHKLRTFGAAIVLSTTLSGCIIDAPEVTKYLAGIVAKPAEERAKEIRGLGDPKNTGITSQIWALALGNTIIYLPETYKQDLTRSEDIFMKTVFGSLLARNDGLTYEGLVDLLSQAGLEVPFNRETFNFYKGYGKAWIADLEIRNSGLKARYALYKKRIGAGSYSEYDIDPEMVRVLLLNDRAFTDFLTNNSAANYFLTAAKNTMPNSSSSSGLTYSAPIILQPITIGVLPALGS